MASVASSPPVKVEMDPGAKVVKEEVTKAPPVVVVKKESPTKKAPLGSGSPNKKLKAVKKVNDKGEGGKLPFHNLMLPAAEQPPKEIILEPTLLTDRKLRRDYLSRRFRAYHAKPDPATGLSLMTDQDHTLWSGASKVERAFVGCCELPPYQQEDNKNTKADSSIAEKMPGGSLARGYEVRFCGLVAKHGHNFHDRFLALAILERTLEQDQIEAKEEQQQQEEEKEKEEKQSPSKKEKKTEEVEEKKYRSDSEEDEDEEEEDPSDDDDWRGPRGRRNSDASQSSDSNRRSTRRSTRLQTRRGQKRTRQTNKKAASKKEAPKSTTANNTEEPQPKAEEEEKTTKQPDRMTVFFSAGGLKILKTWLMDAMTPVHLPGVKGEETQSKPSEYGRMLLPLLHLLSNIPFDKNLVVESKINKQIRKLSKHVDGLIDSFKKEHDNKKKEPEKLQKALDEYKAPGAGGCVVIRVQEILNELKATWEEHAKKQTQSAAAVKDPFESLKKKLKQRLGEINDVEAGKIEKPEWLTQCQKVQRERERKRPREELPASVKKAKEAAEKAKEAAAKELSMQQKAAQEREAERAALQDKLKAAQEERKAHLQRLKNQISKRMHGDNNGKVGTRAAAAKKRKIAKKTVKWKDGLSSDKQKNRDVLEEVFLLPKDPAIEEAEKAKEAKLKLEAEAAKAEEEKRKAKEEEEKRNKPKPVFDEMPPPEEDPLMEPDPEEDEDLFEYDDTLLL